MRIAIKRTLITALLTICVPSLTLAELTPLRGVADPRVRVVDYNPSDVVRIATFFGVSTHIQFAEGETIKDVAIGDELAWQVKPRANHLFIKPQTTRADTNVTVVTSRRPYQFVLIVQPRQPKDPSAWADQNLIYSLSFRYPDDDADREQSRLKAEALKHRLGDVKSRLTDVGKGIQNFDYWVAGSQEVSPTAARDDGRFIYLTFSNNHDMPAVFAVTRDGVEANEALINTHVIDGHTIVVQKLVSELMLRKGSWVASVVNRSFNLNGGADNTTGTVSPDVERIIKGARE